MGKREPQGSGDPDNGPDSGLARLDRLPVSAIVEHVTALVKQLLGRPDYAFRDDEVLGDLKACYQVAAIAEAMKLTAVNRLLSRPGLARQIAPASGRHQSTERAARAFLTEALHVGMAQAGRDVRGASAITGAEPALPQLGAALAAGRVQRGHLDAAASIVGRLSQRTLRRVLDDGTTGAQFTDQVLTDLALQASPGTVDHLGKLLIHALDPDRADGLNPQTHEKRSGSFTTDFNHLGHWTFRPDPAAHAELVAIFEHHTAPTTGTHNPGQALDEHGQPVPVPDTRTRSQRLVDLFLAMAQHWDNTHANRQITPEETPHDPPTADHDLADQDLADDGLAPTGEGSCWGSGAAAAFTRGTIRRCPVQVLVFTTVDQLAAAAGATDAAALTDGLAQLSITGMAGQRPGAGLDPATLARLSCDGPLQRVLMSPSGAVLDLGRAQRLAPAGLRRALAARDLGCVVPGCGAPVEWCNAHHVISWATGGQTTVDNMVLLCSRHHTAVHANIYQIEIRDGIPWVRMPFWIDPKCRWLHNITHHYLADSIRQAHKRTHHPNPP